MPSAEHVNRVVDLLKVLMPVDRIIGFSVPRVWTSRWSSVSDADAIL